MRAPTYRIGCRRPGDFFYHTANSHGLQFGSRFVLQLTESSQYLSHKFNRCAQAALLGRAKPTRLCVDSKLAESFPDCVAAPACKGGDRQADRSARRPLNKLTFRWSSTNNCAVY